MRIRNINFGARVSQSTFAMLTEARQNGLKTGRMENLIKKVYPDKVIHTRLCENYTDTQSGIIGIKSVNIISPKSNIPVLDLKTEEHGSMIYSGVPYAINQETVDKITKNLETIYKESRNKKDEVLPVIEKKLVKKLGEPIADNIENVAFEIDA